MKHSRESSANARLNVVAVRAATATLIHRRSRSHPGLQSLRGCPGRRSARSVSPPDRRGVPRYAFGVRSRLRRPPHVTSATSALWARAPLPAVVCSAGAIAVLLLGNHALPVGVALIAVVVPLCAWLVVFEAEQRGHRADVHLVAIAVGALMVLAVALEPIGSHDLWSYTMYGRLVSQYGVSPYSHVPQDFPHDPLLHLVARGWRHTPSVYGPVFIGFSTVSTALTGGSALAARLVQQASAAIAVSVALALIWRRSTSPAAVMLLGLNPLVILSVVNGGHNDALVGLGVLGAVLLAERERAVAAGFVLGLAALVKVTALLALPALLAWVLYRFGRRAVARLASTAIVSVAIGYAIAGPGALRALDGNHRLMSRASVWQVARSLLHLEHDPALFEISRVTYLDALSLASVGIVCGLAVAVAWRRRRDAELGGVVALSLAAYLVAGIYVLPWYAMWILPAACLTRCRRTLVYIASLGTFLTAVYVVKDRSLPAAVEVGWWWLGAYLGPLIFLIAFLIVGLNPAEHAGTELLPSSGPAGSRMPKIDTRQNNP